MSGHGTHVHWGMVINNYDDTDLALLAEAYPDHIRKLVYTKEVGEGGTPHIQAFIKMKRDCRLSHMRKLFPKGHFNYLESLEYKLNAERYAQKQDQTADGPSVITNGDPLHSVEGTIRTIALAMSKYYDDNEGEDVDWDRARRLCEIEAVQNDYTMAKIFVSPTYKSMWKDFGHDMFQNILHTHTHTHTQSVVVPTPPPKEFRDVEVQTDEWNVQGEGDYEEGPEGSDEEDDDATGDVYEDGGDEDCEGTDSEGSGE